MISEQELRRCRCESGRLLQVNLALKMIVVILAFTSISLIVLTAGPCQ